MIYHPAIGMRVTSRPFYSYGRGVVTGVLGSQRGVITGVLELPGHVMVRYGDGLSSMPALCADLVLQDHEGER